MQRERQINRTISSSCLFLSFFHFFLLSLCLAFSLPFWRTPSTTSSSLLLCPVIVLWPIILTFLSCFGCFLVSELCPASPQEEVNRHIPLLPVGQAVRYCRLPASILFCFLSVFPLLSPCLCFLFCGQKCGILCGSQPFDFDCFVLIEMFLQTAASSAAALLLLLRALPQGGAEQTAKRIRTSS